MKLSIIIVSFNTSRLTVNCVKSIFKFAPAFKYEIIVVDNGSTDDSVKELLRLKKQKPKLLKIIENGANLGFSAANNIGIKNSSGKYKLLLNSDTLLTNDVCADLVEFAENTPDAGVVAPKLLNEDGTIQSSIFPSPTVMRALTRVWFEGDKLREKYALHTHEPAEVEAVVGAAFLITPKALKEAGLLNEKYFMYFEDLDYCRSVRNAGLKVYYLPCSYLTHLHGGSGNGQVNKYSLKAGEIYFGKVQYHLYTFIMRAGNKVRRILKLE